ncbi:DUF167 family protein [Henriciella aquimarina]|uniref:DUF167 family protein n=1 Tax=Henriciella aquimarina TaxID=545261 RepID=UPI0009FDB6C7|nr:DUF167 family protein [Henriciella aquimarina]
MRLTVRVTPNASADAILGRMVDDAGREFLKVKVRAVPEGGKANRAVEKLLAKRLKLAKSAVRVVTGETSRIKGVDIEDPSGAAERLISEWMSADG